MGGWFRAEFDGWEAHLAFLQANLPGGKVDRYTAIHDLRWLADKVLAPGSATDVPSIRELAARWGWSKSSAQRLLNDMDAWCDPRSREAWDSRGTVVGQSWDSRGTPEVASTPDIESQRDTSGTPLGQSWDSRGTVTPNCAEQTSEMERPHPPPSTLHPPPHEGESVVSLRVVDGGQEAEEAVPAEPEPPKVPSWAKGQGLPAARVFAAVLRALTEIRATPPDPDWCATDAKEVLKLWRALGKPPPEQFADELVLVARWARESCDPLAENDIRGRRPDGSTWGADRSRSVSTLCVHSRWGDRLSAAQREQEEGGASGPYVRGDHPGAEAQGRRLTPEERKAWTWD